MTNTRPSPQLKSVPSCYCRFVRETAGQQPLVCHHMKGAHRLLCVFKLLVPQWDVAVVLDELSAPLFKPPGDIDLLLPALASTK